VPNEKSELTKHIDGFQLTYTEKNDFATATKLGTTNIFFLLLQTKILLQRPNVLLIEQLNILL